MDACRTARTSPDGPTPPAVGALDTVAEMMAAAPAGTCAHDPLALGCPHMETSVCLQRFGNPVEGSWGNLAIVSVVVCDGDRTTEAQTAAGV